MSSAKRKQVKVDIHHGNRSAIRSLRPMRANPHSRWYYGSYPPRGRPQQTWDTKLEMFCRCKALDNWKLLREMRPDGTLCCLEPLFRPRWRAATPQWLRHTTPPRPYRPQPPPPTSPLVDFAYFGLCRFCLWTLPLDFAHLESGQYKSKSILGNWPLKQFPGKKNRVL